MIAGDRPSTLLRLLPDNRQIVTTAMEKFAMCAWKTMPVMSLYAHLRPADDHHKNQIGELPVDFQAHRGGKTDGKKSPAYVINLILTIH